MNIDLIISKILSANKILILPSQPADLDCLCSALIMRWFVREHLGKIDVRVYSFFQIPNKLKLFPEIDEIEEKYLDRIDVKVYDLIIGVDGSGYDRYLTNGYQKYLSQNDIKEKFINFDHHQADNNSEFISELNISDPKASSTTLVLYKELLKDLELPTDVVTWVYTGISSDTGNFKWSVHPETMRIAGELLERGANYLKASSVSIPLKEIEFTVWAIQHTKYIPELHTTLLSIDQSQYEELDGLFGDKWDFKDLDRHYKNTFCTQVENYDYYLILKEDKKTDNVRVTWRMRDLTAKPINFTKIMQNLGYEAGGHLNSASARAYGTRAQILWSKLKPEMEKSIKSAE